MTFKARSGGVEPERRPAVAAEDAGGVVSAAVVDREESSEGRRWSEVTTFAFFVLLRARTAARVRYRVVRGEDSVVVLVGETPGAHTQSLDGERRKDVNLRDVVVDGVDEVLEVGRDVADGRTEGLQRVEVREVAAEGSGEVGNVALDMWTTFEDGLSGSAGGGTGTAAREGRVVPGFVPVDDARVFDAREEVGEVGRCAANFGDRTCRGPGVSQGRRERKGGKDKRTSRDVDVLHQNRLLGTHCPLPRAVLLTRPPSLLKRHRQPSFVPLRTALRRRGGKKVAEPRRTRGTERSSAVVLLRGEGVGGETATAGGGR